MQIKIDSEKKEITVLETVKIDELLKELEQLIPNIDWEEWSFTGSYDNYFRPYYSDDDLDLFDLNDLMTEN